MNRKDDKSNNYKRDMSSCKRETNRKDKVKGNVPYVKDDYTGMIYMIVPVLIISMILLICVSYFRSPDDGADKDVKPVMEEVDKEPQALSTPESSVRPEDRTDEIYTYLQGPQSWKKKREWSGSWGKKHMDGGSFGGFGCGLCCLANVYSSVTPYRCTPVQMYKYAKKVTGYGGGGAISWGYMRRTLTKLGFEAKARKKPQSYKSFQKQISSSICSIVLVSSNDSKCYWKDTPGHYVTIFLYDEKKDKVFLADSGDPEHNRKWISLKKIYRSLKTASDWQYITVKSFDDSKCGWKNDNVKGKWVKPGYIED